jgi:GNAT superfamily N-acetyltransferase
LAQQTHGVMEIPEREWPPGAREANRDDIEALVALGPLLSRLHRSTPVFSSVPEQTADDVRADVLDDFADDRIANLVYELDGRIVANFCVCPLGVADGGAWLARSPGAAFIPFAVTEPQVRGNGIGSALADAAFAWAHAHGYETMVTDWRETNLLASRFWPRRGFRKTFIRLHRWIG